MRYFLSAAGSTFHVGSSRLTLKLLRLSELSCLPGFEVPEADGSDKGGVRVFSDGVFAVEVDSEEEP